MAETGLADLLAIMKDPKVGMRNRVNAAVSASRVSALSLGGESEPPAIVFLKHVIDYEHGGERYSPQFRRESAAALAYWQRRCATAQLKYAVPDEAERRASWRRILNGALRIHLKEHPRRNEVLFGPTDPFEMPAIDPDVALSALLGGARQQSHRRQKAIDERVAGTWSGTEEERRELLRPLVQIVHARLKTFGLAK